MVAAETTAVAAASGILKLTWIIALLPVISAALTLFFGKRTPGRGAVYGILALAGSWVLSILVLWHFVQGGGTQASQVEWFNVGPFHLQLGQYIDGLAAVMLVVVTSVSLCVHVYSLGYMHGDKRFTWFYFVLSMFTAAMLDVIIAPNLFQLLIGWEVMGVCSYLLIGHWWEEKENSNASIKAFITTRIGDVPFMFGIFALIAATGFKTSNITEISTMVHTGAIPAGVAAVAAILLFGGTIGKSAQFPLHVWLPDAMAGPTPVSALIHAATMVAAGVYLVGRMYTVFIGAETWVLQTVSIIGAITMLGAALLALVQNDIKRVLAYSTLSQLAYMVAVMGVGPAGRNAAFFHLFTHAFFKALLFLGAGSVIHSVHSNNMSDMGGLRKYMPVTFLTFVIGSLALAGIFPFAGFWSKDELLVSTHDGHMWLFIIMVVTAALTAFYTMRMVWLTFFGAYEGHGHPEESPASMTGPLVFLAAATVGVGFLGSPLLHAPFFKWVYFGEPEAIHFVPWIALLGTAAALGGIALAYAVYKEKRERDPLEGALGPFWGLFQNRYYIDAFYMRAIIYPVRDRLSAAVYWFNQNIIDGVVNGVAALARGVSVVVYWFDRNVIDGFVNAVGSGAEEGGGLLKYLQSGNVQWYAVGLFVGVIALTIIFVRA
ncbi:MAG: NADH-quinone oxidoreductase subunit [Actinomycetota bacterium]|nr:NADH-quinone oxidoreductase subunit [Actinomycetota bacterium]